ncbi:MAG: PorT family protein [Bacteroidales bacterium]|nr:PorT family protein [Bacteroidales bacterium]
MKRFFLHTILLILLVCGATLPATAQWSIGLRGGWAWTSITRSNLGRIDETYTPQSGFDVGIEGRYAFKDWVVLRLDLNLMRRSHRMDRNLNYLEPVYTSHHNLYLMLPLTVDFSFGGKHVRGHALLGGYAGYWLRERREGTTYWMTDYYVYFNDFDEIREFTREDVRFCAGVTGGLGLSYDINEHWALNLEALYYYDLTSHHRGYANLRDPRYLNTLSVDLGVSYKF